MAQLWVTANTASECWRLMCKHVGNFAKTRAVLGDAVVKGMAAHMNLPVNAGGCACTSFWRRVGGSCENSDSADFSHRSSSHVRRFRRRPAAGARSRLVDRVRGTHHEYGMFVRTVQDVIVVSDNLVMRVVLFQTSLGFAGTAANPTCFGDLLRYLGDCCGFVGTTTANAFCFQVWSRSKSKSKGTSRD